MFALCFISRDSEVLVSCLILIGWEGPEVKQRRRSHNRRTLIQTRAAASDDQQEIQREDRTRYEWEELRWPEGHGVTCWSSVHGQVNIELCSCCSRGEEFSSGFLLCFSTAVRWVDDIHTYASAHHCQMTSEGSRKSFIWYFLAFLFLFYKKILLQSLLQFSIFCL